MNILARYIARGITMTALTVGGFYGGGAAGKTHAISTFGRDSIEKAVKEEGWKPDRTGRLISDDEVRSKHEDILIGAALLEAFIGGVVLGFVGYKLGDLSTRRLLPKSE